MTNENLLRHNSKATTMTMVSTKVMLLAMATLIIPPALFSVISNERQKAKSKGVLINKTRANCYRKVCEKVLILIQ